VRALRGGKLRAEVTAAALYHEDFDKARRASIAGHPTVI
jgi:hypothetical protein